MLLILCIIYNYFIVNNMYTQFYSNSRHDSFIDGVPSFKGKVSWKFDTPFDKEKEITNRLILSDGDNYFVDALTEIICIGADGKMKWRRSKWYGSQIVCRNNLIYYQSLERKDDMEAVDYKNNLVVSGYPINGIIDESNLVMFQPDAGGLIAQVYYSDIIDTSVPEYIIYQSLKNSLGYTWYKKYVNQICPAIPLVNYEKEFVLTFSPIEGHIFQFSGKSKESKPDYTFKLPIERDALFVSSSKNGDIYLAWSSGSSVSLKCFNKEAHEKYSVEMENDFVGSNPIIMPPLLTLDGFIYILAGNKIFCIKEQKVIWTKQITSATFATVFVDNSIIITAGKHIIHFDSNGNKNFSFEAEDLITAPIVLNSKGGLVFCTKNKVYSLD
jgi:hypothetical protein